MVRGATRGQAGSHRPRQEVVLSYRSLYCVYTSLQRKEQNADRTSRVCIFLLMKCSVRSVFLVRKLEVEEGFRQTEKDMSRHKVSGNSDSLDSGLNVG